MALPTAAEFRTEYPQIIGTDEDTLLGQLIAEADGLCAEWCGLPRNDALVFTLVSGAFTFYPAPRIGQPRVLDLPHPLVTAITTAHADENWDYGDETVIASGDRLLDTNARELWLRPSASGSWSTAPRANRIVTVAGITDFDPLLPTIAAEVRHLLTLRRSQGVTNQTLMGASTTRNDLDHMVPPLVQAGLSRLVVWSSRVG